MKILVVNGPNLNLLGEREPEIYGSETLEGLNIWLEQQVEKLNKDIELIFFQSNHEGQIVDFLQSYRKSKTQAGEVKGCVLNAGALTHYSIALRDAIAGCQIPTVEVHISDIHAREEFRHHSVIQDVCIEQISGEGKQGYLKGVELLLSL
jgi:3-dehydroquinate dehydratase-2